MCNVQPGEERRGGEEEKKGLSPPKSCHLQTPTLRARWGSRPNARLEREVTRAKDCGRSDCCCCQRAAEGCCGEQETSALCKRFHLTAVLNVFYLLFQREVKSRRNAEETTIM